MYFLGDTFPARVINAGGSAGFAEKYGLKASTIQAYAERKRKTQIGTLILIAAVIDLNERPKCPLTTVDDLKKVALSLVDGDFKEKFEKDWDEMFV
jgi:hypothetical protein